MRSCLKAKEKAGLDAGHVPVRFGGLSFLCQTERRERFLQIARQNFHSNETIITEKPLLETAAFLIFVNNFGEFALIKSAKGIRMSCRFM